MGEVFTVHLNDWRDHFQCHERVADAEAGGARLEAHLTGTLNVERHAQVCQGGAGARSGQGPGAILQQAVQGTVKPGHYRDHAVGETAAELGVQRCRHESHTETAGGEQQRPVLDVHVGPQNDCGIFDTANDRARHFDLASAGKPAIVQAQLQRRLPGQRLQACLGTDVGKLQPDQGGCQQRQYQEYASRHQE